MVNNKRNKILVLILLVIIVCIGALAVIQSDLFYGGRVVDVSTTSLKVPDNFSVKSGSNSMGATLKNSNGSIWIKKGSTINKTASEKLNYNWIDINKYDKISYLVGVIHNDNLTLVPYNTTAYSFTKDGVDITVFIESGISNPDEIIKFMTS